MSRRESTTTISWQFAMCMNNHITKKCYPGLGAKVRGKRNSLDQSLQLAATRGRTTPQTWLQLEHHDLATMRTIRCVAHALNVSVDELLGEGGDQ